MNRRRFFAAVISALGLAAVAPKFARGGLVDSPPVLVGEAVSDCVIHPGYRVFINGMHVGWTEFDGVIHWLPDLPLEGGDAIWISAPDSLDVERITKPVFFLDFT